MSTKSSKSITVRDVAREAGVSLSTVSAALHNTGRVGEKQRKHIRQIADRLNYQPRMAARMLRATRKNRVGLLITDQGDPTRIAELGSTGPVLGAFIAACQRRTLGYSVEFMAQAGGPRRLPNPEQLAGGLVDGAIVVGYRGIPEIATLLEEYLAPLPWVALGEPAEYAVLSDIMEGIFRAVEYLVNLGHRKIAFLGHKTPYFVHRHGLEGFRSACQTFSLPINKNWVRLSALTGNRRNDLAVDMVEGEALLKGKDLPTAVVCDSVPAARCLIYAAMLRNMRVPEDLSVVANGTASDAEKGLPTLSCIEVDNRRMVDQALDLLSAQLGQGPVETRLLKVTPSLVERDSVAPCARG